MTMPPDHELDVRREHAHEAPAAVSAMPTSEVMPRKPQPAEAWRTVDGILKGTTPDTGQLPQLVAVLDDEHRKKVAERIADLAKVASGDDVLEVANLTEAPFARALAAVLAAKPEVTIDRLRRFVTASESLDSLDAPALQTLETRFKNAPFLDAFPGMASRLEVLQTHEGWLRWFVETTPPAVTADLLARHGTSFMPNVFDKDPARLWAWLDHVRLAGPSERLGYLLHGTKLPAIRQKLSALIGATATMSDDQAHAYHAANAGGVAQVLAQESPTRAAIFDAINKAGGVEKESERTQLLLELKRLAAGADDILAATRAAGIGSATALQLLMAARDVTPQHVLALITHAPNPLELLVDARALREIRTRLPTLQLLDLLAFDGAFHDAVLKHEPLRRWFFAQATPRELLAFIAERPQHASAATRLVARQFPDWRWVLDLTADVDERHLRILAQRCNHARTEQHVRSNLLGDYPAYADGKVEEGVQAVDPRTKTGQGGRFVDAIGDGSEVDVIDRLLDLDDSKRLALGRDRETAKTIADRVMASDFARVAYLLDLSFATTIYASPAGRAGIIGSSTLAYLHGRPRAEELLALASNDLIARAAANISDNLLVVFPSLRQPAQLAKSLQRHPELLQLLLRGSDANVVVDLISREPVLGAARPYLEDNADLIDRLPRLKHLTKTGRAAVERLGKETDSDSDLGWELDELRSGDSHGDLDVEKEGRKFHRADKQDSLADAIESLVKSGAGADSALALLESHRAQVPQLLTDRTLGPHVRKLAALVDLPPHLAIPYLGAPQLIQMPNALSWFFAFRDATTLLHLLVRPIDRALVAGQLTADAAGARAWLARLPRGAALTDAEERTLDALRPLVRDADVLRDLFAVRFGMPAPAEYDLKHVDALYRAVSRLPAPHLQQGRIAAIKEDKLEDAAATWDSRDITMHVDTKLGQSTDSHAYEDWYSRDQLRAHYGYDDAAIKAQLDAKRLETRVENGVEQFRMKKQPSEKFTQVVLHEVGHAVDDMLGNRTEPVFGWAQWRAYDLGEFDLWAAEMGGWNKVKEADRPKIRKAWTDALLAKTPVKDLVNADHPAVSKEYARAGVKVVEIALAGKHPDYWQRVQVGDRVFNAQPAYGGGWYSLQANAAMSAPSSFALYAPGEYFAECYAEYYREVDGTPGSRSKRGGGLPSPVKQFFDEHVDKLKYDPQRFGSAGGPEDAPQPAPRKEAAARQPQR